MPKLQGLHISKLRFWTVKGDENMQDLTHFDEKGNAVMVDVSEKESTERIAIAKGRIRMQRAVFEKVKAGTIAKAMY